MSRTKNCESKELFFRLRSLVAVAILSFVIGCFGSLVYKYVFPTYDPPSVVFHKVDDKSTVVELTYEGKSYFNSLEDANLGEYTWVDNHGQKIHRAPFGVNQFALTGVYRTIIDQRRGKWLLKAAGR